MFEEANESNKRVYKFNLSNLDLSYEAKLFLKLEGYKKVEDLLDFDKDEFYKKLNIFADPVLKELNKFGYYLYGSVWEKNGTILNYPNYKDDII